MGVIVAVPPKHRLGDLHVPLHYESHLNLAKFECLHAHLVLSLQQCGEL